MVMKIGGRAELAKRGSILTTIVGIVLLMRGGNGLKYVKLKMKKDTKIT